MKTFTRGQRSRLDALTPALDLQVGLRIETASSATFDFCCFGVNADNRLEDDRYFIFYNQPVAPDQSIALRGAQGGDSETFEVQLDALPQTVRRLVFTASIDGIGTMSQISRGHLCIYAANSEVVRYEFTGQDFQSEQALIVGEIYWKDGWRFGAVGQGFIGNLSRLLEHFGGEQVEEEKEQNAQPPSSLAAPSGNTPPVVPQPAVQPEPVVQQPSVSPTPAPTATPTPTVTPAPVPSYPVGGKLQTLIDNTPEGGVLSLLRDEYEGPVTVRRAISIEGRHSVVWARQGPVLTVDAPGVVLRDLDVEVTVLEEAMGAGDVAIACTAAPQLHNVGVRGRVCGAGAAETGWRLPLALDLGEFAPRQSNEWHFEVEVPVACDLRSSITGLSVQPVQVSSGRQRVTVQVNDVGRETLLTGKIEVREGEIVRPIAISGRAAREENSVPVQGRLLWSPDS